MCANLDGYHKKRQAQLNVNISSYKKIKHHDEYLKSWSKEVERRLKEKKQRLGKKGCGLFKLSAVFLVTQHQEIRGLWNWFRLCRERKKKSGPSVWSKTDSSQKKKRWNFQRNTTPSLLPAPLVSPSHTYARRLCRRAVTIMDPGGGATGGCGC